MKQKFPLVCVLLALASVLVVGAQNYSINPSVIPGGGGASSNAQYSVTGSIGQLGAGSVSSGGNYSVTGGFWALISVVQTTNAPALGITHTSGAVVISWPTPSSSWTLQQTTNAPALGITHTPGAVVISWPTPSSSWTLQQNTNLAVASGWVTSSYPVNTTNGVSSITITSATGNLFFRLSQP